MWHYKDKYLGISLAYFSMEEIVDGYFSQNFRFDEPGLQQNKRKYGTQGGQYQLTLYKLGGQIWDYSQHN